MKKATIIIQITILVLYFILLSKNFWPEEIVLLFFIPIIIVFIISGILALFIKIFKKIKFSKFINSFFWVASLIQLILCGTIIWSVFPRVYTKYQLSTDMDRAIVLMEDVHPDLYASIDKDNFYAMIDSIKTSIPPKLKDNEANKILSSMMSALKDGHSGFSLMNHLNRGSILFKKSLPYCFKIKDDKIFILKNYYIRKNIPIGSEILSINNKPAKQCLDEISKIMSYETIAHRNGLLQLPMIWGMWNDFNSFEIIYKTTDDKIETLSTATGLIANLSFIWDFTRFGTQSYSFEILEGNIAYINLRAFDNLEEFKFFLTESFGNMKQNKIQDLIIDIRKSSGGDTRVANEFMQYLSQTPYFPFETGLLKISDYLIEQNPKLDTSKYLPHTNVIDENHDTIALRENPLRFTGNTYVLTSGYTFSTALDFTQMVRCFSNGKIIGSETGGRTISFGSPSSFSLPETRTKIKISKKKFTNACGVESDHGLIPDYFVENSIMDDIKNIDHVLEYTIELIKK